MIGQEQQRLAGMERSVVRFLVIAATVIAATLLLIAYKQGFFQQQAGLFFSTGDASGINKGMPVKLFGLQIGNVKEMEITGSQVRVTIAVRAEHLDRIPAASSIKLARDSVVGGSSLHIVPGVSGAATVVAGGELTFLRPHTMRDTLDDLRAEIQPLMSELRTMMTELNRPDGEYRQYSATVRKLVDDVIASNRQAQRLVHDADRAMLAAERAFDTMAASTRTADSNLALVGGKLAVTLDSLALASNELREATRKNGDALHETLQRAPALIASGERLLRDGREAIRESAELARSGHQLVDTVSRSWPFRNMVAAPAMHALPIDSSESAMWNTGGSPNAGGLPTPAASPALLPPGSRR